MCFVQVLNRALQIAALLSKAEKDMTEQRREIERQKEAAAEQKQQMHKLEVKMHQKEERNKNQSTEVAKAQALTKEVKEILVKIGE